jgi:hypothetical protein
VTNIDQAISLLATESCQGRFMTPESPLVQQE